MFNAKQERCHVTNDNLDCYFFTFYEIKLAENLDLENRIYALSERESYITIKDHKQNYETNTKCRLINPAKTDVGKVSKKILSRIVTSLRNLKAFNQ